MPDLILHFKNSLSLFFFHCRYTVVLEANNCKDLESYYKIVFAIGLMFQVTKKKMGINNG